MEDYAREGLGFRYITSGRSSIAKKEFIISQTNWEVEKLSLNNSHFDLTSFI